MTAAITIEKMPKQDHRNGSDRGARAYVSVGGKVVGYIQREEWRKEYQDCERWDVGPWQTEGFTVWVDRGSYHHPIEFITPTNTRKSIRPNGDVWEFQCDGWKMSDLRYTRAAARDTLNRAKRWARENMCAAVDGSYFGPCEHGHPRTECSGCAPGDR